ncbi:MAG: hypothetical protein ACR2KK_12810 [Acidimicrobiales bacterium]
MARRANKKVVATRAKTGKFAGRRGGSDGLTQKVAKAQAAAVVDPAREAAVMHRAFERQAKSFKLTPGQRKALNAKAP